MTSLSNLKDKNPRKKPLRRLGRGPGSKKGKTAARGYNGYGSRSGSTKRLGDEGGQMKLYSKLPIKGFRRGRFEKPMLSLNLSRINDLYNDGETVSIKTLIEKKIISKNSKAKLKILSNGDIKKKVTIDAYSFSKQAKKKLEDQKIKFNEIK